MCNYEVMCTISTCRLLSRNGLCHC